MSKPTDLPLTDYDSVPVEEIMRSGRAAARAERKRFQEYLADNDPTLSAALAAEGARFDILRREVIEPAMRDFAEEAARDGWHISVIRDDDLDRMSYLGTPGIRFYCSRRPSPQPIPDLVWPPSFIAFYGCAQAKAVQAHVELAEPDGDDPPRSEAVLEYQDATRDVVRAMLVAFLGGLKRTGTRHP